VNIFSITSESATGSCPSLERPKAERVHAISARNPIEVASVTLVSQFIKDSIAIGTAGFVNVKALLGAVVRDTATSREVLRFGT
jgi:hypothetical protein